MSNNNEFIKTKFSSSDDSFNHLMKYLGYQEHLRKGCNEFYDYTYNSTINDKSYMMIGIKKFEENQKDEIKILHKKYWNKNDIPVSILLLLNPF